MITLVANNLQDAMAEVKDRLGEGATIVSWRNLGNQIEVTATASDKSNDIYAGGRDGFAQVGSSPRFDVFEHEEKLRAKEKAKLKQDLLQQAQKIKASSQEVKKPSTAGVKKLVKEPPAPATKPKAQLHEIVPILVKAGLSLKEIKPFADFFGDKNTRETLLELLDNRFKFRAINAAPIKAIALIGPPGSGKTITAAKLAARALSADEEVVLISTDTERQGGVEQLKLIAKKLGCGFNFAESANMARNLADSAIAAGKAVFIDCASTSPYEPASMRVLEGLLEATQAEPIFIAPMDMRHDDMREIAESFGNIGAKTTIFTRFDLTQRRAGFIFGFDGLDYEISHISASPFIAGGLAPASAKRLTDMILDAWEE